MHKRRDRPPEAERGRIRGVSVALDGSTNMMWCDTPGTTLHFV